MPRAIKLKNVNKNPYTPCMFMLNKYKQKNNGKILFLCLHINKTSIFHPTMAFWRELKPNNFFPHFKMYQNSSLKLGNFLLTPTVHPWPLVMMPST